VEGGSDERAWELWRRLWRQAPQMQSCTRIRVPVYYGFFSVRP
jgi:hypothetical protein